MAQPKKIMGVGFGDIFKEGSVKLKPRIPVADSEIKKPEKVTAAICIQPIFCSLKYNLTEGPFINLQQVLHHFRLHIYLLNALQSFSIRLGSHYASVCVGAAAHSF